MTAVYSSFLFSFWFDNSIFLLIYLSSDIKLFSEFRAR